MLMERNENVWLGETLAGSGKSLRRATGNLSG
jgi:hypothetical protein